MVLGVCEAEIGRFDCGCGGVGCDGNGVAYYERGGGVLVI